MENHDLVQRTRIDDGVELVELNRPERLNALSPQLVDRLHEVQAELARDYSCRVVVVTGRGRGFCAGVDLGYLSSEVPRQTPGEAMRYQKHLVALMTGLRELPQPIVAAVNGPATGAGLALALASDVRVAGESARFGDAFIRVGLSGCDMGVSWLLPRMIGASRAFEFMVTGRVMDATEAERIGLVSRVVPDQELREHALSTARNIAQNSPFGVRMTKDVMWNQLEAASMSSGIALENSTQIATLLSRDHREAVASFVERRPPRYEDR